MISNTDMYYRFTSDDEPTEEQLETLMQEVAEEVRKENVNIQAIIKENIMRECENAKKLFPELLK